MGGLKLNDTIDFNRKVSYYGKISNGFMQNTSSWSQEYYFPNWEDNVAWRKQYSDLKEKYTSINPYEKYPTFESLRDYCFKEADKDKEVNHCNAGAGWCDDCIRQKKLDDLK